MTRGRPSRSTAEAYEFRKKTGLTQEGFAALLGVSKDTIASLEIGRLQMSKRMLAKMATAADPSAVRGIIDRKVEEYRQEMLKAAGL